MNSLLLALFCLALPAGLAIPAGRARGAQGHKIRAPGGVQRAGYLPLGGIEQYLQVRGQDAANPVMLVLHGGPGRPMAWYSYAWQAELEREYTVVHWDQRGCGNTYYRRKDAPRPTLDLLLSDLDELVDHLRSTYQKERIFLMGHSWGAYLGAVYAAKRPQKLSAFIPVSQMLDFKGSERVSTREAVELALRAGKLRDARHMEEALAGVLSCQAFGRAEAGRLIKLRQLKERYLPPQYPQRMTFLRLFSPYMTRHDLKWTLCFDALIQSNRALYEALLEEDAPRLPTRYEVPVIMVAGAWDWTTPRCMALSYFDAISAPGKQFITVERAGHLPFVERPGAFCAALLQALHSL